jgi:hypothetical protein
VTHKLLGNALGAGEVQPPKLRADGDLLHNGVALNRHFLLVGLCVAPARITWTRRLSMLIRGGLISGLFGWPFPLNEL